MHTFSLRYCGTCNPRYDVDLLARRIRSVAAGLGLEESEEEPDLLIQIDGCETACAGHEEGAPSGGTTINVQGESGGSMPDASSISEALERALWRSVEAHKPSTSGRLGD